MEKRNIIILGAGFAGLTVAKKLAKLLRGKPAYQILLIDERDTQIYTPDLYEIATAFNKNITEECLTKLKETVATPFSKIAFHGPVFMMRDTVTKILPEERKIELKRGGRLAFEYLVCALGNVTNYYDIPGLREFSYPLKTLTDALGICCHMDMYFHQLWKNQVKKKVNIVVGGGGVTGVEFACELPGFLDKICTKYQYPRDKVKITIIEGSEYLAAQDAKTTEQIRHRLRHFNIETRFNSFITAVTEDTIRIKTYNETISAATDILIWTGGVKPHPLIRENFAEVAKNGALPVNEFLQHPKFPRIFAAGDNAFFLDPKTKKPAPMLGQIAFGQAPVLAENLIAEIFKKPKRPYSVKYRGIIIPLGGKFALFKKGRFVMMGFFPWLLRRFVDFMYLWSILPFIPALKKWIRDTNVFVGND